MVPGGRPEVEVLTREESIAFHDVDFSSNRPWEGSFSFHDPSQHEAWRERMAWNAQLIDQLLEEAEAAQLPVAFLYIPAYQVFLRELGVNLFADSSREVAERRGAVWIDGREVFGSREKPWELYHAHDGHLNARGHAVVADALIRELAPRLLLRQRGD